MPLGDHLRADQHVELARVHLLQGLLRAVRPPCAVAVQTADARRGPSLAQRLLDPLRTVPDRLQILVAAGGAGAWHRTAPPAVVAA